MDEQERPGDRFRVAFERFERAAKFGSGAEVSAAMRGMTRAARGHSVVVPFPARPARPVQPPADIPPAA